MSHRRSLFIAGSKGFNLLLMVVSFGVATWAEASRVSGVQLTDLLTIRLKVVNFVLFLAFLALWHLICSWVGLYRSRRLVSAWVEARDVVKATSMGSVAVLTAGFLFNVVLISPQFIVVFWLTSSLLTMAFRLVMRELLHRARRSGRNLRKVLIVGTNSRALRFARKIQGSPELGYSVVGFADDDWFGLEEFRKAGMKLICSLDKLQSYLRGNVVDEVIIALPASSGYVHSARIVRHCEEQGIVVRVLSDLFELRLARATVEVFHEEPVISLYTGSMVGGAMIAKRALDFTAALLLIAVQLPVFLLLAVLIKLTSPGPVFFSQERIGLNKRRFRLLKFRTMVVDAEARQSELEHLNEASGPVFKIRSDPRITPLGRVLRKTSLDEMPQLINVLKGDMSLVGPRPLPVRDFEGFDEDWHRRRFSVRPGITCLWQVNGRSSLPFEQWMELDMQYIDEWSLWLDMKILLQTIPAVVRGAGAA